MPGSQFQRWIDTTTDNIFGLLIYTADGASLSNEIDTTPPQSEDRDSGINDGSSALGPQSNNPMKFQLVFAARFNHDPTWRLIQIAFSQSTHTFPFFLSNQRILDSITSVSDHHFRSIHQDRSGPSGPSSIKRQVCGECRPASNDVD